MRWHVGGWEIQEASLGRTGGLRDDWQEGSSLPQPCEHPETQRTFPGKRQREECDMKMVCSKIKKVEREGWESQRAMSWSEHQGTPSWTLLLGNRMLLWAAGPSQSKSCPDLHR